MFVCCSCFSCTYGERCRFLHQQPNQQQRKSNAFGGQTNKNPFGFGSASASAPSQQPKNNPFGFGSQNTSQSNGAPRSDSKPNQFQVLALCICVYSISYLRVYVMNAYIQLAICVWIYMLELGKLFELSMFVFKVEIGLGGG